MNRFDERYDIRLANKGDMDVIMRFIDDHWRKGHIMSTNKTLFEYEYVDGEAVNFVLAIDKNTGEMEGTFGFLRCSHTEDPEKKDIWGSIWKVNPDHDNIPLLGIELAKRVCPLTGSRMQIGNGANPNTTVPLRKLYFREKTVKMKQYYLLNEEKSDFRIAEVHKKWKSNRSGKHIPSYVEQYGSIQEVKQKFNIEALDALPYKDNWYLNKRYFHHPWYKYKVYGLFQEKEKVRALMMTREVESQGSKVLRIVDYLGDQELFAGLDLVLKTWIDENDYEYIDFYNYGFDEQAMLDAGFHLRDAEDVNIIPNYFEPFLKENVDIWAHYSKQGTMFYKADGDQDRPNVEPEA